MVGVSGLEGILLKLQKEHEERLQSEREKPYRKASFEKAFTDLSGIFVRALQSFYQRGLIEFDRQSSTFESPDFGSYAAEVLTISAGDRTLALVPRDGQAATLSAQPLRGPKSLASMVLAGPDPANQDWAYRTEDFVGSMPSPAKTWDRFTFVDDISAVSIR